VKLSVLVSTRNRAHAIAECLDSIAASLAEAAPLDAEIVVVDNGSEDPTSDIVKQWATATAFPVRLLFEPRVGMSVARNLALRTAKGELLAFIDDDCRMSKEYVSQLLHHDANDGDELVLRGGRIELGDPTDLPVTFKTTPTSLRFNRRMDPAMNPTRHDTIIGQCMGCNLTMRRAVVERLGPYDERFGPGAIIPSAEDADYLFRAYLADITLEYVPDMTVFHYHGRKQKSVGYKLMRSYAIGSGALYAKYFFKHPNLCRPVLWEVKAAIKEMLSGSNTLSPFVGFSHKHKAAYVVSGAVKYFLTCARLPVTSTPQARECKLDSQ
jgi:glycosyltransferase involved in cell wall biosynthesis